MQPPDDRREASERRLPSVAGPPPLRPFGLVLHRDGSWSHEGQPIRNQRLRAAFDRGVRYLHDEGKYVVQLGRYRGQIEIEEVGFFVRDFDSDTLAIHLSDGSTEILDIESLRWSDDGALLCTVKTELAGPAGVPARFRHAAQAELLQAVDETATGPQLRSGQVLRVLPRNLLEGP